jgi:hypothetical protein
MQKNYTSLHEELEKPFIVPGYKGQNWDATKENFFHLAKTSYFYTVLQSEKYIIHDDMYDPDAAIDELIRDNTEPVLNMLAYCQEQGMPVSISEEIRPNAWMIKTKKDVIRDLCTEAKKMRERKIYLRKHREDRRKNGFK